MKCPECGASVRPGESCRDHFHDLLALEWQVPGGPGEPAHFQAVASYVLQHPVSMGYLHPALCGLRLALAEHLAGEASVESLRTRTRELMNGPSRVVRRQGEEVPRVRLLAWRVTVADVLAGGADGWAGRVREWAAATVRTLEEEERVGSA